MSKFQTIDSLLRAECGSLHIVHAETVACAIEQLKVTQFSFVILDLQLPMFPKERPKIDAGIQLLKWIKKSQKKQKCRIPSNIIGLTEFPDLLIKFNAELDTSRVFAYAYNENDETWRSQLKSCVEEYSLKLDQEMIKVANDRIIFSVHGIETNGAWQDMITSKLNLEDADIYHFSHKYNFFPVFCFLIPLLRASEVERFKEELEYLASKHPGCVITLIGHSFGTYLIAKSLESISQSATPAFDRIILCGSVLKASYNWENVIKRHKIKNILNDCSLNDFPLILSQLVALGLGMAGRVGFKRKYGDILENRYIKGGHSDFFSDETFGQWERFIKKGTIAKVDMREDLTILGKLGQYILLFGPWLILTSVVLLFFYWLT
jgi:hypothetical protein